LEKNGKNCGEKEGANFNGKIGSVRDEFIGVVALACLRWCRSRGCLIVGEIRKCGNGICVVKIEGKISGRTIANAKSRKARHDCVAAI
jgi:hypothetical protein